MAAFLKEAGIPEEMEGYLYGDDDIVISLDGDGKVETVSILSGQYSWYGMKVGEAFPAEQAENVFEMYGYGFVMSYENQYFYAVNSGQSQSADGAVRIKLYDDQRIHGNRLYGGRRGGGVEQSGEKRWKQFGGDNHRLTNLIFCRIPIEDI